ncbi:MAG TPA: bifunctional precorrin-2 dehydrogenase/sirohydrochlorin ferrochelatase [Chitinophagaceae bacterium]|nr:bifunctional precorrin-2 dehydrogenase/sirohydrochlorin ferrochelatase [Chitinophagaceae bacterium]
MDEAVTVIENNTKEGNHLFPVFLKLEELNVLLIGAGSAGLEKLNAILNNSPATKVTVVAQHISEDFNNAARRQNITLIKDSYSPGFLEDADIVICAVNDPSLSKIIRDDAKQRGKLVNVADKPALCDFYLGSIVSKGNLKLAISTNGKSPTLAKRLREVFSEMLPGELDEVMDNLQQIREQLKGDFAHKVSELNRITKTLVEKPAPKDAEDYWFL